MAPGDAFTVPDGPLDALMVPVHAPWFAVREAIDYVRWVRSVRPTVSSKEGLPALRR